MYVFDNPVMQRELLVNLRMKRGFILLLVYQLLLACVVVFAWPRQTRLEANADQARGLVNMFFLGQYILASLMAPSFAASTITGEKERKTYEMLLASPLRPAAVCLGKLFSSLVPLALLILGSLPIVMLCLPLGGVSIYEVLAAYLGLILSVLTFGMISIACSSYFQRTSASLVASYLLILPLALLAVMIWTSLEGEGEKRLALTTSVLPIAVLGVCVALFRKTSERLLHPPDVGSEGKDVVDLEQEAKEAVGLVIRRDQFPDMLFAPPKRESLMADGANAVYDKEMHSEIFAQGTLMLRLVIQISMFLAIPIMAYTLFYRSYLAGWYVGYVVLFNMLVGPVFSAGSLTSERERQTLDLLLTTTITPWQILSGKLLSGLRVSSVLTLFLVWPLFLGVVLVTYFWGNVLAVASFFTIIFFTCVTTALLALFCSALFQKTVTSLMTTYIAVMLLFCLPLAVTVFAKTFLVNNQPASTQRVVESIHRLGITSPFAAAFSVPLSVDPVDNYDNRQYLQQRFFPDSWGMVAGYLAFTLALNLLLFLGLIWLLGTRWLVSQ